MSRPLLTRRLPQKETMNDIKNIFIAWISTSTSLFAAIELKTVLAILSAIVLPIVFFSIGKTVDVLLQIYLRKREDDGRKHEQ